MPIASEGIQVRATLAEEIQVVSQRRKQAWDSERSETLELVCLAYQIPRATE
jgi:hypothetical protein